MAREDGTAQATAQSISRPAKELLHTRQTVVRVWTAFHHACNLITAQGDIIALVTPQIGDGPRNIVLNDAPDFSAMARANTEVVSSQDRLRLDGLKVDLTHATVWEPCPNWDALRAWHATIVAALPFLHTLCAQHPPNSIFAPLLGIRTTNNRFTNAAWHRIQSALPHLDAGWEKGGPQLQQAGRELAGLGNGSTPAGDDFMAGAMLWAWLAHPAPDDFCANLVQAAAPRTSILAAAFLRAAARGQCNAAWHTLLDALAQNNQSKIKTTFEQIACHGATSGMDMLVGFLYFSRPNTLSNKND